MMALAQLRALAGLIAPAGVWLPGRSDGAADESGHSCRVRAPEAVRFGLLGGLMHLDQDFDERLRAVGFICRVVAVQHLYTWEQDPDRTEAEVRDAVRRAIMIAEAEDRS